MEVSYNNPGRYNRFRIEPFGSISDDTAFVDNVDLRVIKSSNDSFQVTVAKFVNGRTRRYADTLAALMTYNIAQKDSLLLIDRGVPITEQDKFRNQHVVITIAVPVGKKIKINKKVSWGNRERFQFPWADGENNYDWDTESFPMHNYQGEELIMREDGLYTLDGKPANENWNNKRKYYKRIGPGNIKITVDENDNETNSDDSVDNPGYRYDRSVDSIRNIKEREVKKLKDSLQKKKDELEKKLEKLDNTSADAFGGKYDFILSI
jgi:hypothetical protein